MSLFDKKPAKKQKRSTSKKKKDETEKKLHRTEKSLAREKAKRKALEQLIDAGWRPPEKY